jgi:hypothetical protein
MKSRGKPLLKHPASHPHGRAVDRSNRKLARDQRVPSVLLSIADGLRICRVLRK